MVHIAITGASGLIGSHAMQYVLSQGHTVTAIDIAPLPANTTLPEGSIYCQADCTDFKAVEAALRRKLCDGVIHLSAIPNPRTGSDARTTHNVNVVASYNVMRTAADLGIKRIVNASSINAVGLLYTADSRRILDELPLTEETPRRPEDPYSLSKLRVDLFDTYTPSVHKLILRSFDSICEIQADSICRLYGDIRISSLRFHHHCPKELAISRSRHEDLWSWVDPDAASRACLLGITANEESFTKGHEAFFILCDDLVFGKDCKEIEEGFYDEAIKNGMDPDTVTAEELVRLYYPGTKLREGWWSSSNPRRSLYDTSKAQKMLGWHHGPF